MFFGQLHHNFGLLSNICVIWINKHELIVIRNIEILFYLQVLLNNIKLQCFLLDEELRIIVAQEWLHALVLLIAIDPRIFQFINLLQLEFICGWVYLWLCMTWQVFWSCENVRVEGIKSDKCVILAIIVFLLDMTYFLDSFLKYSHSLTVLLDWCACVTHTKHFQTLDLILRTFLNSVFLTEYKLLIQKLFQIATIVSAGLTCWSKLWREYWMEAHFFWVRNLNLVAWDLFLFVLDDIILLKLKPFIVSYKENNKILEMKRTYVICSVRLIHNSVVNFNLIQELTVVANIIKLDCFYKATCVVIVMFKCFDHWNITLFGANDVNCHVSQIVWFVLCNNVAIHSDLLLDVTFRILVFVKITRKLEVCSSWILNKLCFILDVLLETVDTHASLCIFRCIKCE